jgi:hypothetical protein
MGDHHHRCRFEDIGQGSDALFLFRSVHGVSPCPGCICHQFNAAGEPPVEATLCLSPERTGHAGQRDRPKPKEAKRRSLPAIKSCCCPVYADPDRVAGNAESALKELRLNSTKT